MTDYLALWLFQCLVAGSLCASLGAYRSLPATLGRVATIHRRAWLGGTYIAATLAFHLGFLALALTGPVIQAVGGAFVLAGLLLWGAGRLPRSRPLALTCASTAALIGALTIPGWPLVLRLSQASP